MKKFVEILEEIKQTGEAIRAAETNEKKLIDSYIKLEDIKSRIAKKRAVESEMIENSENIKNLKITMKILKNNARVSLFLMFSLLRWKSSPSIAASLTARRHDKK